MSDTAWRLGAAAFWLTAGATHFLRPRPYEAIVPPPLHRAKREVVALSGAAELAGGLAVLPAATRRGARWWLLATLVAIYPANLYMALHPERFPRIPRAALWARLPVQGLFGWVTWRGTR
ncbi:MAG TPA: hypothetical protein VK279_09500 [Solirubrobacteraceae bacterium]|nr:hypothetical protein [Solirubrobacteraceae bacterium]